ncbi:hypothetical protein L9F63_015996 [Diploptera punctata]|uniref:Sodium/potassium-transporting ATPase subunit beta-2 n=1 Tax=Diploptera punctata TaxID=6984 RepID=A0AAD8EIM6_DIPPU|nr:hypothetical protein L9F63_015996 [Diploptera punctata]
MEKSNKFIDPMDTLFAPPPNRSKWETFSLFIYNPETNAFLGRTASSWAKITVFYIIFYACLAAMWAVCLWGLLQTVSEDEPTYLLDRSLIGSSPGLASRPMPPEGRESILSFEYNGTQWHNSEWPQLFEEFLQEYENATGNDCTFNGANVLPCKVDIDNWKQCKPDGKRINASCIYFKINKVMGWTPKYYTDKTKLPSGMPQSLKDVITKINDTNQMKMVWLSCEGRHEDDKQNIRNISFYPHQGFPAYYFPFQRQPNYKSPVVAVHFENPVPGKTIDVECRSWAQNIQQDRKEQQGVLNFKLKFNK